MRPAFKEEVLPIIVGISVPPTRYDPDAVDTEVYCVNTTSLAYAISVRSESFTTVDEEEGTVVEHGSAPGKHRIQPGEYVMVADVEGWEWDGHVGIEVSFQAEGSSVITVKTYNLKEGGKEFLIAQLKKRGRIIAPGRRTI